MTKQVKNENIKKKTIENKHYFTQNQISSFTQSNNETLSYYNIYTQQKIKAAFVSLFITLRLDKSDYIKK